MPPDPTALFSNLVDITTFEILNSSEITDFIFGTQSFTESTLDPLNDRLALSSYNTSNFIYNMGTSFYIVMLALTLTLILWIVTVVNKKCGGGTILIDVTDRFWRILTASFYLRLFI
jgi:hypothetical protein